MENKYDLKTLIQRAYDNIPGSPLEKAAVTARIFYVEKEINLTEAGAYRKADIVSLIESAVEDKEKRMLAVRDNLEQIAIKEEPNNLGNINPSSVIYKMVKEKFGSFGREVSEAGKVLYKILRYSIYGALPGNIQKRIADKNAENEVHYSIASSITGMIGGYSALIYGAGINYSILAAAGGSVLVLNLIRFATVLHSNHCRGKPIGSVLLWPYLFPRAIAKRFIHNYQEKRLELEQKKKLPEIGDTGTLQLPSPKSSRHKFIIR